MVLSSSLAAHTHLLYTGVRTPNNTKYIYVFYIMSLANQRRTLITTIDRDDYEKNDERLYVYLFLLRIRLQHRYTLLVYITIVPTILNHICFLNFKLFLIQLHWYVWFTKLNYCILVAIPEVVLKKSKT